MAGSLYIHIPFCKRKCIYCNFYSCIYKEDAASSYMDALLSQITKLEGPFKTIYVGGGTPTVLSPALLKKLAAGIALLSDGSAEYTFEANPESIDPEKLKILAGSGVNRLSIGLQSMRDEKLKKLGRIHGAKKAIESVVTASKAGFTNISIDMIFGVWAERPDNWKKELKEAVKLPVKHVSCYEITYESGTPLFEMLENKAVAPPGDDAVAEMYGAAIDELAFRGFKQYEVSNFAMPGFESRHNTNYWNNSPYIGLGASAFSYDGSTRSRNVSDAFEYARLALNGKDITEFSETLTPEKRARETAAVKIRTKEGIGFAWFKARTGYNLMDLGKRAIPKLIEDGLIKYNRDRDVVTGISLKRKGFLLCDTVSSSLL